MATGGMTEATLVGRKQEILPKIFNRQPDRTPFLMALAMADRPKSDLMTWQAEKFDQRGFGGVMEGAPVGEGEFNTQLRELLIGCVAQVRDAWKVTSRANAQDVAGIGQGKEAANQELKSMVHLRFKLERMYLSANTAATENGGNPFTSWGVFGALNKTLNDAAQFPIPGAIAPVAAQCYTGDVSNVTEAQIRGMLGLAFEQIKTDVKLMGFVGRILRHILDDFTSVVKTSSSTAQPRTIFRVDGNSRYINKVVDIETSEGQITLVTSPFLLCNPADGSDTAYTPLSGAFVAPEMWKRAPLVAPYGDDLPKDGSGPKGFTETFEGLQPLNPLGQFAIQTATNASAVV